MSDQARPFPPPPDMAPHPCMVCGAECGFGFETYRGTFWTCWPHIEEGRKLKLMPVLARRAEGVPSR